MKKSLATLIAFSVVVTPLYAAAPARLKNVPSLLEAAEVAAASGAYRPQNTPTVTTGRIREGDKKRSALAYGLSGIMAFAGAGLWRWLPCRNVTTEPSLNANENTKYFRCYNEDGGRKKLEPPTKALLLAGAGLELVSLGYLIAHLMSDGDDP